MPRASLDATMLGIAQLLALRATCTKLAVGCVLTDSRNRIIGSGYNGVPCGVAHCTEVPCAGNGTPSGSNSCIAVHAEMNALLSCADTRAIRTCYTNYAPCLQCAKTLLNTDCQRIVYLEDRYEVLAKDLWQSTGRRWEQYCE